MRASYAWASPNSSARPPGRLAGREPKCSGNQALTPWLWLSLTSAACLGFYEVSRKRALFNHAPLWVLLEANLGGLAGLVVVLIVARVSGVVETWGLVVVPLTVAQHGAVFLKSCLVTASWVCAFVAVKELPITIAGPLRAIAPAFTVLGALLIFQEQPSAPQWAGIGVIFVGYLMFARVGRREGIQFFRSSYVVVLLLGTLLGSMSGLYDKHLLGRAALHPTTLQFWFLIYASLLEALLIVGRGRLDPGGRPRFSWSWGAPLAGLALFLADQFYFRALAEPGALVSVVSLVRRSSVIVSFSVGAWLFQEQLIHRKAFALLVVLTGLLILITGK